MKIRHNCLLYLPTIVLLLILWHSKYVMASSNGGGSTTANTGRRKKLSSTDSSILEIMNRKEIESLLSTQVQNDSENPILIDSEMDYTDIQHKLGKHNKNSKRNRNRYRENSDINNNDGAENNKRNENNRRIQGKIENNKDNNNSNNFNRKKFRSESRAAFELLVPYNESISYSSDPTVLTTDAESDLETMRGDKILKSSRNALYITKKEYLQKDWCKTEPLVQRIHEPGCLTRTFVNRFCYGQCNSFYIPKNPRRRRIPGRARRGEVVSAERYVDDHHFEDEDLTGHQFQSCGFCKPKKFTWITVTLRCPSETPQLKKKRIQRIKQCKCMAVSLE